MNTQLTNDDPEYPGLMAKGGKPVDYSNGGYIESVSPSLDNGPGIMEVTHFYNGNTETTANGDQVAVDDTMPNWRTLISTDHEIKNAKLTFTAPADMEITEDSWHYVAPDEWDGAKTVNDYVQGWSDTYKKYTWSIEPERSVTNADNGTFTIDLGDLPAGEGRVIIFNGHLKPGEKLSQNYVASAQLTGTYDYGVEDCAAPADPSSTPATPPTTPETPSSTDTTTPGDTPSSTPSETSSGSPSDTPASTPSQTSTSASAPNPGGNPGGDGPNPGSNPGADAPNSGNNPGSDDNGGQPGGNLPRTGSDTVGPLLAVGAGLILLGAVSVLIARRNRQH